MFNPIQKLKSYFLSLNLSVKFVLLLLFILPATMTVSAFYTYNKQQSFLLNSLQNQTEKQSGLLASISKEAILSYDYVSLNNYMREFTHLNDVVYGVVLAPDGKNLTSYIDKNDSVISKYMDDFNEQDISSLLKKIDSLENILTITSPIQFDDELIGYIKIGIDKSRFAALTKNSMFNQLYNSFFIIAALSIFIYLVLKTSIYRQIENLMVAAARISKGTFDTPVHVLARDELGVLTITFNNMMTKLRESDAAKLDSLNKLQELNQHLEDIVHERTERLILAQSIGKMGHWDYEIESHRVVLSPEACKVFGLHRSEIATRYRLMKLIHNDDKIRFIKAVKWAIQTERSFNIEVRIIRNEKINYLNINGQVTLRNNCKFLFGIAQDVTERTLTDISAKNALIEKTKAETENQSKSAFLANMSHEIRTPLTAIIGFAEAIVSNHEQKNVPADPETVNTILRNARHLLHLINEILDLSKIESNKLLVENIPMDIDELCHDVITIMQPQANSKNLEFKFNCQPPYPQFINSDPVRLKQILINLISNAVKFTTDGHVHVTMEFVEKSNHLKFTVKDTGIGIKPEDVEKLFTPFSQADSSITRKFGGTGLGLHISKCLINLLGGDIEVESIYNLGTRLTFYVDTGEVDKSTLTGPRHEARDFGNIEKRFYSGNIAGTLLVVEDNEDNQELITLLLRDTGLSIDIAENGRVAVEKASSKHYDLILMDVQMPEMDGITATKILREKGCTSPIVALTANAMKQDRDRCRNSGFNDFLTKPIENNIFKRIILKYLKNDNKAENSVTHSESYLKGIQELRGKYIERLKLRVDEIIAVQRNNNEEELQRIFHNLKGSGSSMGFPLISEKADQIQNLIREGQPNQLSDEITEFIELCRDAIENVNSNYDSETDSESDDQNRTPPAANGSIKF